MAVAKAAYPSWQPEVETVAVWSQAFQNDPADLVAAALRRHIESSRFPPTIAEIFDRLSDVREKQRHDERVERDREILQLRAAAVAELEAGEPVDQPKRPPLKLRRFSHDPRLAQDGALLLSAEERLLIQERRKRAAEELKRRDETPR